MRRSLSLRRWSGKFRFWDCDRAARVPSSTPSAAVDVTGRIAMTQAQIIEGRTGATYELGNVTMRLLARAEETNGAFALGEFSGGEGPWTVPHVHRIGEESFYVLDG